MGKRRFTEVWRVWAVMAAIVLATLVVTLRLVQLQIVDHAQYAADARLIHYGQDTLADRRGALLDRNGYPLAASEAAYNVMVEKRAWNDPANAQAAAEGVIEMDSIVFAVGNENTADPLVFQICAVVEGPISTFTPSIGSPPACTSTELIAAYGNSTGNFINFTTPMNVTDIFDISFSLQELDTHVP